MLFISDNLEAIIFHLDQIQDDTKPLWGKMSAQQIIEHLTDGVLTSSGKKIVECPYSGEKLERSRFFLMSDEPMPKNFKAHFVDDNAGLRNESFELAVDEFVEAWVDFEDHCLDNPEIQHIHPVFGQLNLEEWRWMHRKHITHHFTQFGVVITDFSIDEE